MRLSHAPIKVASLLVMAAAIWMLHALVDHHRPWPVNGGVINNSNYPVSVWDNEHGIYVIPPHTRSSRFSDDVDHVASPVARRWYKLGLHTATIGDDGNVTGAMCPVSHWGRECNE